MHLPATIRFGHRFGNNALYGICQFLREYLEPKLLGGKMGIRPVHSLMAVYIGYELFGVLGLFLGPFGLVLIKSMWRVTEE